jgi:hypothetical protein
MPIQRFSRMLVILMATCFFTSVAPVMAHHSHAMFDSDQEITITGKVAGLRYANPHVRLLLEVESEAGEIERWDIEMSTIVNMRERGVTRATFPSGAEVTITINPLRDGGHAGNYSRLLSVGDVHNMAEGNNWDPSS